MFLMERNSGVMEFFPKGWLKLAGVGQYVYHLVASWSGMKHQESGGTQVKMTDPPNNRWIPQNDYCNETNMNPLLKGVYNEVRDSSISVNGMQLLL
ncbi:hypothetical protein VNO80_10860 [Phaseolus coccineus]|uniref:Uncharacterized protein n=1 Tax=Phaseolus coccineus TaxID=3886 RepID=A0AAN9NE89_PHACN